MKSTVSLAKRRERLFVGAANVVGALGSASLCTYFAWERLGRVPPDYAYAALWLFLAALLLWAAFKDKPAPE